MAVSFRGVFAVLYSMMGLTPHNLLENDRLASDWIVANKVRIVCGGLPERLEREEPT